MVWFEGMQSIWDICFLCATCGACLNVYGLLNLYDRAWYKKHALDVLWVCVWVYVGMYSGARLWFMWFESDELWWPVVGLFEAGPMSSFGGIFGGMLAWVGSSFVCRLPWLYMLDAIAPSMLWAMGIGRVGCFLNGDDYGMIVSRYSDGSLPFWAVTFSSHPVLLPRVPVQLIEAVGCFWGWFWLTITAKHNQSIGLGSRGAGVMIFYGILRFMCEYLRDDFRGPQWGYLSWPQWMCLVLGVCGVGIYGTSAKPAVRKRMGPF